MELEFGFNVTARCKKFDSLESSVEMSEEKEDVQLSFNAGTAEKFLFRFNEPAFMVGEYKLLFKFNNSHMVENVILTKDEYIYIVTNTNQLINDVARGYYQIRTMDKVSDILEFDFKAGLDFSNVKDEFEE